MKRIFLINLSSKISDTFTCCIIYHNTALKNVLNRGSTLQEQYFVGQWRTQEFFSGGGSTNSVEDRMGLWGRQPPSQGFWRQLQFGTRNFISYNKRFLIFGTLDYLWWQPILFVTVNVKQLGTEVLFDFYCLFPNVLGYWCPKFSNF
jgi:hypothetical protein